MDLNTSSRLQSNQPAINRLEEIKKLATFKERVDQHDREIAAIRKLINYGMKLIVRIEEAQKQNEKEILALTRSLRGANGNGKAPR